MEDEGSLRAAMQACLLADGYAVLEAGDGEEGLRLALAERPALLVLDLALPSMNGLEVCGELRRQGFDAPILMVTGRRSVEDRVHGLDAGADDYLPKPFDTRELLARVRALLRRGRAPAPASVLEFGPVRVDLAARRATRAGEPLALTKTEFALLELLARTPDLPVSRATILEVIWGYTRVPDTRTVDTHVWRLRKKLGDNGARPRWIQQVTGAGYRLAPANPASTAG